jgi:hypothetical protein
MERPAARNAIPDQRAANSTVNAGTNRTNLIVILLAVDLAVARSSIESPHLSGF